jgi:peptide/nickel transport system permease protein
VREPRRAWGDDQARAARWRRRRAALGLTFARVAAAAAARWQAWRWHGAARRLRLERRAAHPAAHPAARRRIAALAGGYHVFGTDKVGQDVLYLTLKSIRTGW